jgi:hypothetical protein
MSTPATAGPNRDGSRSLAPESKAGTLVQFVVTTGITGALAWLAQLDTSHIPGYAGMVVASAVGLATGLGTAYLKKNR